MKTLDKISILCIGLLLLGCTASKESIPEGSGEKPPQDNPKPAPESHVLTFVLPEDGFKTEWEVGDAIVVHGEYAADQVTVTLQAGDISFDKKTASLEVSGLYPYVNKECSSTLYAAWPAEAVDNLAHCFWYTGFNSTNTPMLAACNDSDYKFAFKNLSCRLTFKVDGPYDGFAISGRKDAVISCGHFQVLITDKEQNLDQYRANPLVTVNGTIKPGAENVQSIYLPGSVVFPKGYTLLMYKDGKAVKAYNHKTAASVELGKTEDIGDITNALEDFELDIDTKIAKDLSEDNTKIANCYIVTEAGTYKIPTVRGNTTEAVEAPDNALLVWETWNNREEVTRHSVIQSVHYEGNYLYFRTPDVFHAGNAIVAVRDEADSILWSWHIWLPKTPVTEISDANFASKAFLSRNLGALEDVSESGPASVESLGLLYQWGRKDPFPGMGVVAAPAEGDPLPVTIAGSEIKYVNKQATVNQAVGHPNVYYFEKDKDWQNEGQTVAQNLWKEPSSKTMADPCPYGYQMPSRDTKCAFFNSYGSSLVGMDIFKLEQENCKFKLGTVYYPLAGYLGWSSNGSEAKYIGAGENIIVWTGRWDSGTQNGYGMYGTVGGDFKAKGSPRALAGSARCVKQ